MKIVQFEGRVTMSSAPLPICPRITLNLHELCKGCPYQLLKVTILPLKTIKIVILEQTDGKMSILILENWLKTYEYLGLKSVKFYARIIYLLFV